MNQPKLVVCHVLNELLPSGAETMLVNSAKEWHDCELHVLGTQKELGIYKDEFKKAGYTVHHVYKHGFIKQHMAVVKFFKELKPDVVHVHRESQECYYEFDARVAGVPRIVRTVHSVFSFSGILRLRRTVTRTIGRELGTKYVAISQSVYENERTTFKNTPFALIDNWCDEHRFHFAERELNTGKDMVIISVGNCGLAKNHMFILQGILELVESGCTQLHYYHVGSGTDETAEKEFVEKNNLQSYVTFAGHADPLPFLKKASLFVMPSAYEGVGISAIEAMYMGIPCLLTDVNGLKDFKALQSKDVNFCKLNQSDFNSKLHELYQMNLAGKLQRSKSLSDKAAKKYSMKKSVDTYLNVYRERDACKQRER